MVHEFIRSIIENRKPVPDDILGAYWTGVGICAHRSANTRVVKNIYVPSPIHKGGGTFLLQNSLMNRNIPTYAQHIFLEIFRITS